MHANQSARMTIQNGSIPITKSRFARLLRRDSALIRVHLRLESYALHPQIAAIVSTGRPAHDPGKHPRDGSDHHPWVRRVVRYISPSPNVRSMLFSIRSPSAMTVGVAGQFPSLSRHSNSARISVPLRITISRRFDDQHGVADIVFLDLIARAGHRQIGDAEILIGPHAGNDARCRDHRTRVAGDVQVSGDRYPSWLWIAPWVRLGSDMADGSPSTSCLRPPPGAFQARNSAMVITAGSFSVALHGGSVGRPRPWPNQIRPQPWIGRGHRSPATRSRHSRRPLPKRARIAN